MKDVKKEVTEGKENLVIAVENEKVTVRNKCCLLMLILLTGLVMAAPLILSILNANNII